MFTNPVTKGVKGSPEAWHSDGRLPGFLFLVCWGIVMKNKFFCLLLCLLFLSIGSLSWSQDNQVQEKRLSPAADTSVSDRSFLIRVGGEREQERCVNCGSSGGLSVVRGRHTPTGGHIHWRGSLIRFDLSEIPPGSEILEARLFLYHYNVWEEQISIHRMLKNWTELEATWWKPCEVCDPWRQGWSQGNYASSPTFSQQVTGIDQWFDWDVTGDVKAFLGGTSNYGWFLKSAETTGTDSTSTSFYSKESNNPTLRPYLQVRYLSSPPPPLTVKITSPTDDTVVNTSPLTVTGTVSDPTATVTVNGVASSISSNTFQASIDLVEGQNTITAQATDQYGQAATDSVTVALLTKGTVAGTVTDSQSGLPLSSAAVSVTDVLSVTQTELTGAGGTYAISNVASGALSGSVTKDGYASYPISGNMSPGQTITISAALSPIYPTISNVAVSGITSSSATVTWTTDQPADSRVDYGTTASYGNFISDPPLTVVHEVTLMGLALSTTHHFKVTSTNTYGFSSSSGDGTFLTLGPRVPLVLSIDSPKAGANLSKSEIMVEGTVSQESGLETGVVVNGRMAVVTGNHFIANRVPLEEGQNQITAVATDVNGNTATASVTVNATLSGQYIRLTANIESGIAPLETILSLDTSLNPTGLSVTYTGPADVEFLSTSENEYRVRLNVEGTYFLTAQGTDSAGATYTDTIAISVLSKEALDTLLRSKWEGLREKLSKNDIEQAINYFVDNAKETYRYNFELLRDLLPVIAQDMGQIRLVDAYDQVAKYELSSYQDGIELFFFIKFVKDIDGLWKIYFF